MLIIIADQIARVHGKAEDNLQIHSRHFGCLATVPKRRADAASPVPPRIEPNVAGELQALLRDRSLRIDLKSEPRDAESVAQHDGRHLHEVRWRGGYIAHQDQGKTLKYIHPDPGANGSRIMRARDRDGECVQTGDQTGGGEYGGLRLPEFA